MITEKRPTMIILNRKKGKMSNVPIFKNWYMKNRSAGDVGAWFITYKDEKE